MKNSNWELVESKFKQPIQSPLEFGRLKLWWDESLHSCLSAMLVAGLFAIICLLPEIVSPPSNLGKSGNPDVKIVQVVLGSSPAAVGADDSDVTAAGHDVAVEAATNPRPVDSVETLSAPQPVGALPAAVPPKSDSSRDNPGRESLGDAVKGLADAVGRRPPRVGAPLSGFQGLGDLFKVAADVKSVVYVVDKSSSMAGSPIVSVKAELIDGINSLQEGQQFGVIFFDDFAWPMLANQGTVVTAQASSPFRMLPATTANKKLVTDWVLRISADGGTNPVPAVMLALGQKPQLIKLLSDGEFHPNAVLEISRENKRLRSKEGRIDCVGLGERIQTLQDIAAQNSGVYYQARMGP